MYAVDDKQYDTQLIEYMEHLNRLFGKLDSDAMEKTKQIMVDITRYGIEGIKINKKIYHTRSEKQINIQLEIEDFLRKQEEMLKMGMMIGKMTYQLMKMMRDVSEAIEEYEVSLQKTHSEMLSQRRENDMKFYGALSRFNQLIAELEIHDRKKIEMIGGEIMRYIRDELVTTEKMDKFVIDLPKLLYMKTCNGCLKEADKLNNKTKSTDKKKM